MAEPNLRADLVAALAAGLPADEWKIIGYPETPARVEKRTVALWAARITPPVRLKTRYPVEVSLEVTTAYQSVENADDDLDGALIAVLNILLGLSWFTFTGAERTTNQEKTQHSWTVQGSIELDVTPDDPTPED